MKATVSDAKARLPELVRAAEQGQTVELTRYGNTQAVIISQERYQRLTRDLMEH
ncbi:type II toxin-antitoxin system prevent-host-death family antitoxin [Streptomyces sp. ScaeMP-e48]|uniref:type II toxin-antitoxin system prevent-host-death family antitoxin n=1 Tax=Streptomyces sp. ScaeMP-e48 TaxID=1100823 RepID=UPI000C038FFD